jgi:FkbM family methyltransferase
MAETVKKQKWELLSDIWKIEGGLYLWLIKPLLILQHTRFHGLGKYFSYLPPTKGYIFGFKVQIQPGKDFHKKYLNTYENYQINWIPEVENQYFFDIGAHSGRYTLEASRLGYSVVSFEPSTETFNNLQKNIELNNMRNRIDAYNVGVSHSEKMEPFKEQYSHTGKNKISGEGSSQIRCLRLDRFRDLAHQTGFVKIDVEGHEKAVIRGGTKFFEKTPIGSFVALETVHQDVSDLLENKGYKVVDKTLTDTLLKKTTDKGSLTTQG